MARASRLLSILLLVLGILILAQTIRYGGGMQPRLGYVLGPGLMLAGALRLYVDLRMSRGGER